MTGKVYFGAVCNRCRGLRFFMRLYACEFTDREN